MAIRILLADDHSIIREGLSSLLKAEAGMEVVGEAKDGKTAIELACQLKPDVVVMDVNMPGIDGIDATGQIVKKVPSSKVVALSMYQQRSFVEGMLKAGASAYILKDMAFSELVKAIHTVMADEVYLCTRITAIIVDSYVRGSGRNSNSTDTMLTNREREILQILAEGKNTKQIALALHISTKTVDTHRRHIMRKLDLHSLPELTKYAIRRGLSSLE